MLSNVQQYVDDDPMAEELVQTYRQSYSSTSSRHSRVRVKNPALGKDSLQD